MNLVAILLEDLLRSKDYVRNALTTSTVLLQGRLGEAGQKHDDTKLRKRSHFLRTAPVRFVRFETSIPSACVT